MTVSAPRVKVRAIPRFWLGAAILGGIVASWVAATLAGRSLVRLIYAGKGPAFLNSIMTGREDHPVAHFYEIADAPVLAIHIILLAMALLWLTRARRSAWLWFGILLAADAALILLDVASRSVYVKIWHEWMVPEWSGYLKEILFAVFTYRVFRRSGQRLYACLSALGCMLLLDDAAEYHESMGRVLAPLVETTRLHQSLDVESHFLGEVLSLVPYGFLALLGSFFYLRAGAETRRNARFVAVMVAVLFVFGVLLDLYAHVGRWAHLPQPPFALAWIEDSGEMILLSGLAAFAAALFWRGERGAPT